MAARVKNPCGACLREVTERQQGIKCDSDCGRWYHKDCVKLSKAEYDRLAADQNLKWECQRSDCEEHNNKPINVLITQFTGFSALLSDLSKKMDSLLDLPKKIDALDAKLTSFEDRIACTERRIEALESASVSSAPKPNDIISELNDRSRRACNLIVYNLKESRSGDAKVRKPHDDNLTTKLFEAVCPGLISYKYISTRLGKPNPNKNRPLKVVLKSQSDALEILRNFSTENLKNVDSLFENVKISRDRTPYEIKHLNDLREELKSRQNNGEADITIRYVNGIPSIMKYTQKNA